MTTDNKIDYNELSLSDNEIAIVGIGCRFPQAKDYDEFWKNLITGKDSIKEVISRWDSSRYYSEDFHKPNTSVSKWCGKIARIDLFDNKFFNISPREARNMDPQQRMLLEESWHCIEDSGVPLYKLRKLNTSVLIGVMANDYHQEAAREDIIIDSYAGLGNYNCILANRISYFFGFNGVSMAVDAACASSLVAIHQARHSLINGESDYVLAGGVALNTHPWKYISFSKSRMLSPTGRCKAFDKDANGYVPGEGIAVVLMQRVEDAIKAGNHIYAIIKGSSVNHGGTTRSITAPRVEAQKRLILNAYKEAGFNPNTVSYMEAHGTGTSLGDPIEIEALTKAFTEYIPEEINFIDFQKHILERLDNDSFTLPQFIPPYKFEQSILINSNIERKNLKKLLKFYNQTTLQSINYQNVLYEDIEGYYVLKENITEEERAELVSILVSAGFDRDKEFIRNIYRKDSRKRRYILTKKEKHICCKLRDIFRQVKLLNKRERFCKIGSVKTNIGHLEAAAGIAGLIKVLLMLKHKKVPPLVHLKTPNPIINWDKTPFELARSVSDWQPTAPGLPLRAGVSSFGFGGVNSHVLVEEFMQKYPEEISESGYTNFFLLSAKSEESFNTLKEKWLNYTTADDFKRYSLLDICTNLIKGRESFNFRWGFIARSKESIKEMLKNAQPFIIKEQPKWVLRLGEFTWNSYSQLEPVIRQCTTFRDIIIEVTSILKGLDVDSAIIDGYRTAEWPDEFRTLYSFISGYGLLESIRRLGFRPDAICPESSQLWLGLVISGIVPLKLALGYLTGKTNIKDILFIRPKIPYYDYCTKRTAMPFHFDEDYLKLLVSEVKEHNKLLGQILVDAVFKDKMNDDGQTTLGNIMLRNGIISERQLQKALSIQQNEGGKIGDIAVNMNYCEPEEIEECLKQQKILSYYLKEVLYRDKAIMLSDSQYTFKKYLEEWDSILMERDRNIDKMLKSKGLLKHQNEKLLLMVIIMSCLKKLNQKWNITDQKLEDELRFYELIDLVADNVMPKELVIELFLDSAPDYTKIKSTLNRRQHLGNVEKSYTYIRDTNKHIKEVPDIGKWMEKAATTDPVLPAEIAYIPMEELHFLNFGKTVHPSAPERTITTGPNDSLECIMKHILLELWLKGAEIKWAKLNKEGTYHRLPLPTYPFSRKSFWIRAAKVDKEEEYNSYSFRPQWSEKELPPVTEGSLKRSALVFGAPENPGLQELVKSSLYKEIHLVERSEKSELEPGNYATYKRFIEKKIVNSPGAVEGADLYIFTSKSHESANKQIMVAYKEQVRELFFLVKALVELNVSSPINIIVIVNNSFVVKKDDKGENFSYASLLSMGKTVKKERPNINMKLLDLSPQEQEVHLTSLLHAELEGGAGQMVSVYREGKRYIREIKPYKFNDYRHSLLSNKQVYLFVGGAGGIGMKVSRQICREVSESVLIIAGRSMVNEEKKGLLRELNKINGNRVLYINVDVGSYTQVKKLIALIKKRFGHLNGVLQAGGILEDSYIIKKEWDSFERVMESKIKGTWNLHRLTKKEPLDFFVVFSSIVSEIGNIGQIDYATANGFLDAFVHYRRQQGFPGQSISINWTLWMDGGMGRTDSIIATFTGGPGVIDSGSALHLFSNTMQSNLTQCIVTGNSTYFDIQPDKKEKIVKATATEQATGSVDEQRALIDNYIVKLISDKLEFAPEELDRGEPFFSMGMESVIVNSILSELNKHFEAISPTLLFEYPNIDKLVDYLSKKKTKGELFLKSEESSEPLESQIEVLPEVELDIEEYITALFAARLGYAPEDLDREEAFFSMGLESIMINSLMQELNSRFDALSPTLLFEYPNINKLIQYLQQKKPKIQRQIALEPGDSSDVLTMLEELSRGNISLDRAEELLEGKYE